MADSFIQSVQKLASSVSSDKNGFPWDSAIRRFQYGIAGITLAALAIYDTTSKMQCSTSTPSYPEFYYASSYCAEATWYHIKNGTKEPYEEYLRNFKWYVLIPPIFMIICATIYGALVDSFVIHAIKGAELIFKEWDMEVEDFATIEGTAAVYETLLERAAHARIFVTNYLHSNKSDRKVIVFSPNEHLLIREDATSHGGNIEGEQSDSLCLEYSTTITGKKDVKEANRMGQNTALYYHLYLGVYVIINICALVFINPYVFWFPPAIACEYRKHDLSMDWSICSVPGHRYSKAAVIIVMICHALGVVVALLSFYYLNHYIPVQLRQANAAISSYTRDSKQQAKLHQCWKDCGKKNVEHLTATTRFLLALIYQNIDRTLCYRLIVALIDIKKDGEEINRKVPKLIENIVEMDEVASGFDRCERDEMICELRETVLNPVIINEAKETIKSELLVKWISKYLDDPNGFRRELLKAQMVYRVIGVRLPKQSKNVREKFSNLLRDMKESDFTDSFAYYRQVAAIYDLSKSTALYRVFDPIEIGKISDLDSPESVMDNGHVIIDNHVFDASKLFDTSGYCYRSNDATAYNWIRRSWNREHSIKFVAIQSSHVNAMATPTKFNLTGELENGDSSTVGWEEISETYQSYHWEKDEWRVFPAFVYDVSGNRRSPLTKSIQINIFENGGADYFEIQKVRVYGTPA